MIVLSAFPSVVMVLKLQFGVKCPEGGINTQPHIAICTLKPYPCQHTTPYCNLGIYILSWFVSCGTHDTHLLALLKPVTIILHLSQLVGLTFPMGWFKI
jgi:hypothetical protein